MAKKNQTLGEFIIENQQAFAFSSGELSRLINSIRLAAKVVNHEVNKAGLVDITGAAGEVNVQGEDQQKLDVYANETFIRTLTNREIVCGIASEESDDFITIAGNRNDHSEQKRRRWRWYCRWRMDGCRHCSQKDVGRSGRMQGGLERGTWLAVPPPQQLGFDGSAQQKRGFVSHVCCWCILYTASPQGAF